MTSRPYTDRGIVSCYLGQLRLSPHARSVYAQVLHDFQAVAERRRTVDRTTLEEWLRDWGAHWQQTTLLHRARIVDRFLDHLVELKLITSNPIAVLRSELSVKQSRPIWQALASRKPDRALAALRRPVAFGSVLGEIMREHIERMRMRGYRYTTQAAWFLRFDRFLQTNPELANEPVATMLEHWAAAKSTRHHAAECERLEHALTKALRHRDPSVPPRRLDARPQKEAARHFRKPHIYSPADVKRMLEIARSYPSPRAPLRPMSAHLMLLLAYCAGLRRSELARLDLGDVDLRSGTITIRETKFFKTRILPLPDTVMAELRAYIDARRRAGAPQDPQSGLFWQTQGNGRYGSAAIAWLIVDILRRAELKPGIGTGRTGPRLHDLRHSMVVNRMLQWYRSGINPQDRLPFLATYLGHRDINSTLIYITVTQDLMQEASERFRVVGARCLASVEEVQP
ncbi:Phage integrase family protein [Filomicrobium insigne]|uniref:Phage integrase family protein n=1 Tax=Filomicrobium insigne TaxID=418854 RepID=A0A1H0JN28_9HYPH|nr:tyrosine-type recombinase/integrase [Filomicrobium insigne]SDO44930.1 Phage integrase family protein [Filomicrobium insigne]